MKKFINLFFISITLIIILTIVVGGGFSNKDNRKLLNNEKAIIFAHRGYVKSCIENSTESFLKSDQIGFNAIETDVSCTKDGKLIIFHDKVCKRLLGINKDINELNWDEINTKHLIYKEKESTNLVLSLDMFLKQTAPNKIIYLDIKQVSKSIADSLINILNNKQFKNIIVANDNIIFLNYVKKKCPRIKTVLEGFNKGKEWLYHIIPINFKPDYYSSFISQVDDNHIKFLNENNLIKRKIVYGVDKSNINKVFVWGLKNIILDYSPSMGTVDSLTMKLNRN